MTLFFLSAALLVLLSMAWILKGVFSQAGSSTDQEAVNITLARERAQTLDTALANGSIDQRTYAYEREQLEYDLAADLRLENETRTRSGGQISAAVIVAVFVPLAAGALYIQLGDPAAIDRSNPPASTTASAAGDANQNAPDLADLLPQMQQRLEEQPDDIDGWRLLGRSYLSVGEFENARAALERAVELDDNDVPTLAQLAEATAMTQQGSLAGKPMQIVEQAIKLNPDNEHAVWLMAIAQQQAGDHEAAMQGFDKLIAMANGNAEALATVEQMRVRSVAALSGEATPANTSNQNQAQTQNEASPTEQNAGARIEVLVELSEQASAAASSDQAVFVYATASQGPPMPLAVARLTVADLPTTVTLDNSMAMIPNMTLGAFPLVTVGARVSTTGNPIAQTGDWFNEALEVATDQQASLALTINQQTP